MNEQSSYTASLLWFWVHVSCFCNSCYGETSSTQCLMELLILTGWKETKYASRWLRLIRTILLYSDALSMSIVVIQTPFSLDSMEQEWGAICCMEGRPDRISVDRCYHDSGFLKWISTREPHLAIFFSCSIFLFLHLCRSFQLRKWGWMHHLARHSVACFLTRGDMVCSVICKACIE
jgi:hypothetical protein